MSIVIVGGNECMARRYHDLCRDYGCRAKVYPKMSGGLRSLGTPDLVVIFTDTVSHKMVRCTLGELKGQNSTVIRCHSSSMCALKSILQTHTGKHGEAGAL